MAEPIILVQVLKLPPAQVFTLLSTPAHLEAWLSPADDIAVKVLRHEFTEGGTYQLQYAEPDGGFAVVGGEFVHIDAPRLISFTWEWEPPDQHARIPTLVTWVLKEIAAGTELTVVHEQVPDRNFFDRHQQGWRGALHRLLQR